MPHSAHNSGAQTVGSGTVSKCQTQRHVYDNPAYPDRPCPPYRCGGVAVDFLVVVELITLT